jgi:hypothetical protein
VIVHGAAHRTPWFGTTVRVNDPALPARIWTVALLLAPTIDPLPLTIHVNDPGAIPATVNV